jgi:hypothetical protein
MNKNLDKFLESHFGKLCVLKKEFTFFKLSDYSPGYSFKNPLYLNPNSILFIVGGKEFYKKHCESHGFSIIEGLNGYFGGTAFVYLYGNNLWIGGNPISDGFDEYITIL